MKLLFATISLLLLSLFLMKLTSEFPLLYYEEANRVAEKYGLDPLLVMAMIKVESNFNPSALSSAGAVGLLQVMPETLSWMNEKSSKNFALSPPASNIEAGIFYLKYLIRKFGNLKDALMAYNVGPSAHIQGKNKEASMKYIKRISFSYMIFRLLYDPLHFLPKHF